MVKFVELKKSEYNLKSYQIKSVIRDKWIYLKLGEKMRGTIGTILKFILREKIIKTIGDGLTCT